MPHPFVSTYTPEAIDRPGVDALPGVTVLEFGTNWCPICQGAQGLVRAVLHDHPAARHVKVEDGPGRRLGRSFRIKLWPTLIVLRDGAEVGRVVRPDDDEDLRALLARAETTMTGEPGEGA